jgi:hypothetical protein
MDEQVKNVINSATTTDTDILSIGTIGTYYEGILKVKARIIAKSEKDNHVDLTLEPLEKNKWFPGNFNVGKLKDWNGWCGWSFKLDEERN